jgi:hypothetical protein
LIHFFSFEFNLDHFHLFFNSEGIVEFEDAVLKYDFFTGCRKMFKDIMRLLKHALKSSILPLDVILINNFVEFLEVLSVLDHNHE